MAVHPGPKCPICWLLAGGKGTGRPHRHTQAADMVPRPKSAERDRVCHCIGQNRPPRAANATPHP